MISHPQVWSRRSHSFALIGIVATMLAGCTEEGKISLLQSSEEGASAVTVSDRSVKLIERDVEAPDVFQVTDRGLWDGRPSLGGVWVAHPDVTEPERVIIRNTENSKFVIGALFRRERENPGPILQVSSDAAAELGMLAGAPAQLNVTALRREETPDPEAQAAAEAKAATEAAQSETTAAETEATLAALNLPAAESSVPADDAIAGAAAALSAVEADSATPQAAETGASALLTTPDDTNGEGIDKSYLQIGIFSQQGNAERAATVMRSAGLAPTIKTQSAEGRTFWRVIVGPADSVFQRTSMLDVIRGEGFTDAFPVGG